MIRRPIPCVGGGGREEGCLGIGKNGKGIRDRESNNEIWKYELHGGGERVNHHWHSVCSKENSSRDELFAIISPLTLLISKLVGIFPTLKSTTLI